MHDRIPDAAHWAQAGENGDIPFGRRQHLPCTDRSNGPVTKVQLAELTRDTYPHSEEYFVLRRHVLTFILMNQRFVVRIGTSVVSAANFRER